MSWEIVNTGFNTARFNMDYDESLARTFRSGSSSILRLYGWNPPAISLGFNQSMEDFDLEKITEAGIDIVRRPTGGRAILHSHEITYSVVMFYGTESPRSLYKIINEALLGGLLHLGIEAELTQEETDFRAHYRRPDSIPCFSSSARSEIHFGGRKLIGSAQRRFGDVLLQHGSLLLGPEHRKIVDYLAGRAQASKRLLEKALADKTTDAGTILHRPVSYEEAAAAIIKGFQESCGVTLNEETMQ